MVISGHFAQKIVHEQLIQNKHFYGFYQFFLFDFLGKNVLIPLIFILLLLILVCVAVGTSVDVFLLVLRLRLAFDIEFLTEVFDSFSSRIC